MSTAYNKWGGGGGGGEGEGITLAPPESANKIFAQMSRILSSSVQQAFGMINKQSHTIQLFLCNQCKNIKLISFVKTVKIRNVSMFGNY